MKTTLPNYSGLNQALEKTSLKLHPSQAHGIITGLLCGNSEAKAWEEAIAGGKVPEKTYEILQNLHEITAKQLDEFLFEYQLLLPDDEEPLVARAEALTLWCQGFLTGLKLAKVKIEGRSPSDVTEAINDLIEIAKMNYEEVVSSEEDEEAFVELEEYVRMAAVLIYQDLHESIAKNKSTNPSNHLH